MLKIALKVLKREIYTWESTALLVLGKVMVFLELIVNAVHRMHQIFSSRVPTAVSALLGNAIMALGCLRAAKFLHEHMLTNILRSPMSFFDTTPLGRIVNRFSKDVDVADSTFPANLKSWITCLLQVGFKNYGDWNELSQKIMKRCI